MSRPTDRGATPGRRAAGRAGGRSDHSATGQVTIDHVAAAAGVSSATVSRALNGNYPVAKRTRDRIEQAARELGYVVNAHARALAGSGTRTVGMVVNDLVDPFFAYIARGVERAASERDRLCLIAASGGSPQRELAITDLLLEQRANIVILVGGAVDDPAYRRQMAERARAFASIGSTMVLCGRPSLGADEATCVVSYDNEGGAAAITDHLISLGHRRILYLGGPDTLSTTAARLAGHRRALTARGLPVDPGLVHTGAFGRAFGYQRMREILSGTGDFTAVFAANDLVAEGALQAAREAGLRVPDDLSLVGYDDVPIASQLTPGLTTVHVPLESMGREAVRLGVAAVDGPADDPHAMAERSLVLGTHVVIRDSAIPLRSDAR